MKITRAVRHKQRRFGWDRIALGGEEATQHTRHTIIVLWVCAHTHSRRFPNKWFDAAQQVDTGSVPTERQTSLTRLTLEKNRSLRVEVTKKPHFDVDLVVATINSVHSVFARSHMNTKSDCLPARNTCKVVNAHFFAQWFVPKPAGMGWNGVGLAKYYSDYYFYAKRTRFDLHSNRICYWVRFNWIRCTRETCVVYVARGVDKKGSLLWGSLVLIGISEWVNGDGRDEQKTVVVWRWFFKECIFVFSWRLGTRTWPLCLFYNSLTRSLLRK